MDAEKDEMKDDKEREKELEESIKGLNKQLAKNIEPLIWTMDQASNVQFADLIWDTNELHRNAEYAIAYGKKRGVRLKGPPILGVFSSARVEQYILPIIKEINESGGIDGSEVYYVGARISLRGFNFPGDELKLKFNILRLPRPKEAEEYPQDKYGDVVILDARAWKGMLSHDPVGYEAILSTKKPSIGYNDLKLFLSRTNLSPEFNNVSISKEEILTRNGDKIENPLEKVYQAMSLDPQEQIPNLWYAGFMSSALLDASKAATGEPEGILLSTDFKFYAKPEFGRIKVSSIKSERNARPRSGRYFYEFRTAISDKETSEILMQGRIRAASGVEFIVSD